MKVLSVLGSLKRALTITIWPPRKMIFDHIPKCGGTTIKSYLRKNYLKRSVFEINGYNPPASVTEFSELPETVRHNFDLVQGHFASSLFDAVDPRALRVTVVRDPIERIISHYHYAKRNAKHYLHEKLTKNGGLPLKEYCTSGLSGELENWYVRHFARAYNDQPLTIQHVEVAFNNFFSLYDLIGFQDDIPAFIRHVKLMARCNFPYVNSFKNSASRYEMGGVDEEALNAVKQANELDILLFERLLAVRKDGVIKTSRGFH